MILLFFLDVLNQSSFLHPPELLKDIIRILIMMFVTYILFYLLKKENYDIIDTFKIKLLSKNVFLIIVIISFGLFVLKLGLAPIIYKLFPSPELSKSILDDLPQNILDWVLALATLVAIGPIFEEFIFRGLMQSSVNDEYGLIASILLPALIFSLIHIFPAAIISVFISSCLYGYLVYKTKSIFSSILLHSLNNFISLISNKFFYKEVPANFEVNYFETLPFILIGLLILCVGIYYLNKYIIEDKNVLFSSTNGV
jgi:hypothetical protein